jgi:hypothetical protein
MADKIQNQKGIHAVIVFEDGELKMVVPEDIPASPGQSVQWIVVPPNKAEVIFDIGDSPLEWESNPSDHSRITGTVKRDARGDYNYAVSDGKGNTIDPRLRIRG